MDLETQTLANGLVVASARLPGFRSAAIGVWLRVGSRHEPAELGGLAHFMEHMAFKGTRRRDARRISFEAERVGASMNAWTARDHTAYYLSLLGEQTPMAIDLLADVVRDSTFPPEEIEREREVILQEIAEAADDPHDLVQEGFDRVAYPDQALGRPILGDPEVIRTVQRDCFTEWIAQHHVGSNLLVVGAGAIEHQQFQELVTRHFGDLPAGTIGQRPENAQYVGGYQHRPGDFAQVSLVLGWPIPGRSNDRYPVFEMLAELFGGGMSSPLFQAVRERRGLAYAIDAWAEGHEDCGLFQISAGVAPRNLKALLEVTCEEISRLARGVDPEDLERARNQHRAMLLMNLERPLGTAESIARDLMFRGSVWSVDQQLERIAQVQCADLEQAALEMLRTTPSLSVVGKAGRSNPMKTVERSLAKAASHASP
jgi:predicted Zn-dependent peptidase